jgi:CubicO group peptidase (beta-lactamase class C family)
MKKNKSIIGSILILMLHSVLISGLSGQNAEQLPRSTPESEGVSSSGIIDFLNAVDTATRVELHSFMLIRHGKVIAEGWWEPYGPDYKHLLYSASKTFTATGIGLAISENLLKLSDKVVSFFPYSLPDSISDFMKELTVKHLLTMSVGQDPEPRSMGNNGDWIQTFLSTEPIYEPGTVFKYNNMATFMLSAIVQQVTGQTLFDYLQPRIFQPLGIRGIDWDLNPQGINLGMIGLRLRTEDLAKFGQLLMQNGLWNKKQLIPESWVKEATSMKIESNDPSNKLPKDLNDWVQGYCYQMWRGRNNSVRLDGMAGQFVILFPDMDAVVVLTANARNTQDELNLVHNHLIPAIKSNRSLPANPDSYSELQNRQAALSLEPDFSVLSASDFESGISGKEFVMNSNDYGIQSVYFAFNEGECGFALKRNNSLSTLRASLENWHMSNTSTTSILSASGGGRSKSIDANYAIPQPVIKLGARYSWTDESTLEITGRFVEESLGSQTVVCKFSDSNGTVRVSIEPKAPAMPMGMPGGMPAAAPLTGSLVVIK